MEIVPWKHIKELEAIHPFRELESMRRDLERTWSRITGLLHPAKPLVGEWLPSVELSETKDNLIIKAELPSLKEKDIEVTLSGNILTIKGEKKQENKEDKEKEHYHYSETYYGSFQRSFRLPTYVKADDIDAHFDNGVLKITLPKTEEAKEKEIKIKVK